MKYTVTLVVATLLAGCTAFSTLPQREFYVLEDLGTAGGSAPMRQTDRSLLISQTSASPFYDTQSLVFSRAPDQRAYYQFSAWTERPGNRLTELLIRRLHARRSFRWVATTTAGAAGDLVLSSRLEELYHDASANPGSVRVELTAILVDREQRAVIAQRRFAHSAQTGADNASAAVAAFNRAVTALLTEESAWVEDMTAQWASSTAALPPPMGPSRR